MKDNNNFYSIPKIILNEIFLEKRKHIEKIIKQYSSNYNFESIGFKYNIEQEFDMYLKMYYIKYEFDNIYNYYEIIDNNKNIYINKLSNDISNIKNIAINQYNLTINNFDAYVKNINNLVSNNYIGKIKINNSLCVNTVSDLYSTIIKELNDKKIIESEEYIINHCNIDAIIKGLFNNTSKDICFILSGINEALYYNKFSFLFSDCKKNNFYNYTYTILNNFEEKYKNNLDEIISNINDTIINNVIDENYLIKFIRNYYIENTSFEINMNNYSSYFRDIMISNNICE